MFVQAKHFHSGRRRRLRLVVWHSMEWAEKGDTAEACAREFATTATPKSAHVCVDSDTEVECVRPGDTAFAAPGANADGYQVELAGFARQTKQEWCDPYSDAMLRRAARFVATKPELAHIPARWLTDAELADGVTAGHTTHAQVTRVFGLSTHTDPGAGFPAGYLVSLVGTAKANKQEDDLLTPDEAHQLKVATDQTGQTINLLHDVLARLGALEGAVAAVASKGSLTPDVVLAAARAGADAALADRIRTARVELEVKP